jgi:carboxyl-terminal processing protease
MTNFLRLSNISYIILSFSLGIILGYSLLDSKIVTNKNIYEEKDGNKIFKDLNSEKLLKVYNLLNNNFINPEKLTLENLEEWLIRGVLYSSEDPYTDYFNEEQSMKFKKDMQGDFEGIGAVLEKRKNLLYVVEVLPKRPAAITGLLPGDIIISVDENDIKDNTIWETVLKIRGKKGTNVTLEVIREGEIKEFIVTRDNIHVDNVSLSWKGEEKDIALIEISQFGDTLISEFHDIFLEMQKIDYKGIIIDLRYNGGGYMEGAIKLSSYFLPKNTKILQIESNKGIEDVFYTDNQKFKDVKTPIIILINKGTASASEILTLALTENNRAKTLGEKTFGKGVIQQIYPLDFSKQEFVKITIAKWLSSKGLNVTEDKPIIPNILVEWDRSLDKNKDFSLERYDPQLERALEEINKN